MKCCKCGEEMEKRSHESVEIDRCPACGGLFLDHGELEEIDAGNLGPLIDLAAGAADAERAVRRPAHCHRCDNPMIALSGAGDVEFDWCDQCEGMFFDAGELTKLDLFEE